jgi:hypothetical protein
MSPPLRLFPKIGSASISPAGPRPQAATEAEGAPPPENHSASETRDAAKRNQLLAKGVTPPRLDVAHMSDGKLLASRDTVRAQLNNGSSAPALVSPLDLGGQWAAQAFQDTSAEMKRRGLGEDGSKGQPARVDEFPLPKPGNGGSVETLYANLLAAHQAEMGEARPREGTWLGDALKTAKAATQEKWAATPGVDVARRTQGLEDWTLSVQSRQEMARTVNALTAAVLAGHAPDLASIPDRLVAPAHKAVQEKRLQAEQWVKSVGNFETRRNLQAMTELETALQREIAIRD